MACSIRSFSGISDVETHDSRIRLLSILFISGKNIEENAFEEIGPNLFLGFWTLVVLALRMSGGEIRS